MYHQHFILKSCPVSDMKLTHAITFNNFNFLKLLLSRVCIGASYLEPIGLNLNYILRKNLQLIETRSSIKQWKKENIRLMWRSFICKSWHALSLFMLRVSSTHDINSSFTFNGPTILTHFLHRWTHLHDFWI